MTPAMLASAVRWLLAVAIASAVPMAIVTFGYAGSIMRLCATLRAIGRALCAAGDAVIRAGERHAEESHRRHTQAWKQEAAQ